MSIGERIHALRKDRGVSQGQLASAMGVSRQAVSKWENDLASPDTLNLIKLADLLETEVAYLATGRQPEYPSSPIVVNMVKTVEKMIEVEKIVDKPVIQRRVRVQYRRNPLEYAVIGIGCFFIGIILGYFL